MVPTLKKSVPINRFRLVGTGDRDQQRWQKNLPGSYERPYRLFRNYMIVMFVSSVTSSGGVSIDLALIVIVDFRALGPVQNGVSRGFQDRA